jgi:hypothetical protein
LASAIFTIAIYELHLSPYPGTVTHTKFNVKYFFPDSLRYKRGLSSHKLEDRISEYNRIGTGAGTKSGIWKRSENRDSSRSRSSNWKGTSRNGSRSRSSNWKGTSRNRSRSRSSNWKSAREGTGAGAGAVTGKEQVQEQEQEQEQ